MLEIGKRIKERREELGMTQDELAQKVGYKSRSSINKIENGGNDLPQGKIVAFAKALDTTPSYLMGWIDLGHVHLPASDDRRDLSEPIETEEFQIQLSNPEEFVSIIKKLFTDCFQIPESELESLTLQNMEETTLAIRKRTERALNEEIILSLYRSLNIGGKLEILKELEKLNSDEKYCTKSTDK